MLTIAGGIVLAFIFIWLGVYVLYMIALFWEYILVASGTLVCGFAMIYYGLNGTTL